MYVFAPNQKVTTEGSERIRVGPAGQIGIAGANYGTSGQVLTSGGASGVISWASLSAGGQAAIFQNQQTIPSNLTLTTNYNGFSVGPVAVDQSITVTVPANSVWLVF